MLMPGRRLSLNGYRFGFNSGSEKDNEVYGVGNLYTTEWRELDPRLGGRWWSKDRIVKPWESPYIGFANNPIYFSDPLGLTPDPPKADPKKDANGAAGSSAANGGIHNPRGGVEGGEGFCIGCGKNKEDIYGLPEPNAGDQAKASPPSPGNSSEDPENALPQPDIVQPRDETQRATSGPIKIDEQKSVEIPSVIKPDNSRSPFRTPALDAQSKQMARFDPFIRGIAISGLLAVAPEISATSIDVTKTLAPKVANAIIVGQDATIKVAIAVHTNPMVQIGGGIILGAVAGYLNIDLPYGFSTGIANVDRAKEIVDLGFLLYRDISPYDISSKEPLILQK